MINDANKAQDACDHEASNEDAKHDGNPSEPV